MTSEHELGSYEFLFVNHGPPPNRLERAKRKARVISFRILGKNPYNPGTLADLGWKVHRGKLLSDEEREACDTIERVSRYIDRLGPYALIVSQLTEALPSPLRDQLMDIPAQELQKVIDTFLPLADFVNQRTAVKLAMFSVWMSGFACLISAATLIIAVWALLID